MSFYYRYIITLYFKVLYYFVLSLYLLCNYLVAYSLSCSIILYDLGLASIHCYVITDTLFSCCVIYCICVVIAEVYYMVSLDQCY